MKRSSALLTIACLLFLTISASSAIADTVVWDDTAGNFYWTGYNSRYGDQNNVDVNGIPDILKATFTLNGNYLTGISVTYEFDTYLNGWSTLAPGDWFFDSDADTGEAWTDVSWDTVIKSPSTKSNVTRTAGEWSIYTDLDIPFVDPAKPGYYTSYDSLNGYNSGTYIYSYTNSGIPRYRQPVQAVIPTNEVAETNKASFAGWFNGPANPVSSLNGGVYTAVWTIPMNTVFIGSAARFSFTPTCGNDVIFGDFDNPSGGPGPVPEPGTALLLGLGMLGLAFASRRGQN